MYELILSLVVGFLSCLEVTAGPLALLTSHPCPSELRFREALSVSAVCPSLEVRLKELSVSYSGV